MWNHDSFGLLLIASISENSSEYSYMADIDLENGRTIALDCTDRESLLCQFRCNFFANAAFCFARTIFALYWIVPVLSFLLKNSFASIRILSRRKKRKNRRKFAEIRKVSDPRGLMGTRFFFCGEKERTIGERANFISIRAVSREISRPMVDEDIRKMLRIASYNTQCRLYIPPVASARHSLCSLQVVNLYPVRHFVLSRSSLSVKRVHIFREWDRFSNGSGVFSLTVSKSRLSTPQSPPLCVNAYIPSPLWRDSCGA